MKGRFEVLAFSVIICFLTALLYFNTSVVPHIQVVLIGALETDDTSKTDSRKHDLLKNQVLKYQRTRFKHVLQTEIHDILLNNSNKIKISTGSEEKFRTNVKDAKCDNIKNEEKFDCYPSGIPSQEKCQARGCCWHPVLRKKIIKIIKDSGSSESLNTDPSVDVPWCFYPRNYPGYTVDKVTYGNVGVSVKMSRKTASPYPSDIMSAVMDITYETKDTFRIRIYDPSEKRYQVPLERSTSKTTSTNTLYNIAVSQEGQPFNFMVTRKTPTGLVPIKILDTNGAAPFIFADQFIQLSSFLPSSYVYGLGEHRGSFLHSVNWTRATMWNKDQPPRKNTNLYGSHPFYLVMEERDSTSHGVFLLNSNAMDVILQPAPAVTWRTIGGVIDMFVFVGPSPSEVVQQYTDVIGHSFMPPYWSLGYHLCRWGYKTANGTIAVTNRVRAAGIPQDVQWNDIDYMDEKLDFTTGKAFGDQAGLVATLHSRGMHYMMIVDPGISSVQPRGAYTPYDLGMQMDIFIKDHNGKPLQGKVWPGYTVFPDFTNPASQQYWTSLVKSFHQHTQFDGMWIDMNEISNFVAGSTSGCPKDSPLENPPYVPAVAGGSLRFSTICASAKQNLSTAYNVHNLYGLAETNATYRALLETRWKRPFIISRSTFAGQGQFGGHWSGDNFATYEDMYLSIPEILNFNMFGISMVGADICGFQLDTTEELCTRWHQLGAFYPFSRNHNSLGLKDQDPAVFSSSSIQAVKKVYLIRYSLLPYLYTLFHKSHVMGETVVRPLFFEFPSDQNTYTIDKQFMWGSCLMISPVLSKGAVSVDMYFPGCRWYDFYTGYSNFHEGTRQIVQADMDIINLHVRGGSILPMQEPSLTTTESRMNPFKLLIALDEAGEAEGDLFWDDGDTVGTYDSGTFSMISFTAAKQMVRSQIHHSGYADEMTLGSVLIYGVSNSPTSVTLNGHNIHFTYNYVNQSVHISEMSADMLKTFVLGWT